MTPPPTPGLYSRVTGTPGKPLVVFCHGLFGQGKNFGAIARALEADYRCLMVDLPNHGRSPWTDTVSYVQMADAVAALLTQEHAQEMPCTLLGHSMGGKVAMRVALFHPALVRRLVVVDMSPVDNADITFFQPIFRALHGLDLGSLSGRQEADTRLSAGIPDDTVRHFLMQNLRHEHHRAWHWQMNLAALSRQRQAIADWPPTRGRQYGGPVLWVKGEWSHYIRPAYQPLMRDLFPAVRLTTIKNAGHWVHSEQPDAFISALRAFLRDTADA